MRTLSAIPIQELRDHVVGRGVSSLTLDDVVDLTGLSRGAAAEAMRRARTAGQFFLPAPGLYIPIPSEYSTWGVVPAMDFIDQFMRHLGRAYYVGLLSAAELHGAAHQRPQVFQVMVDQRVADRDLERVRLRFHTRKDLAAVSVSLMNSQTAQVRVSTPEATVLDLVSHPQVSGGLSNVATILGELAEDQRLQPDKLMEATAIFPLAVVRRTGWLLDRLADYTDTADLAEALHKLVSAHSSTGQRVVDLIEPGGPRRGRANRRWGLIENADVEPDL